MCRVGTQEARKCSAVFERFNSNCRAGNLCCGLWCSGPRHIQGAQTRPLISASVSHGALAHARQTDCKQSQAVYCMGVVGRPLLRCKLATGTALHHRTQAVHKKKVGQQCIPGCMRGQVRRFWAVNTGAQAVVCTLAAPLPESSGFALAPGRFTLRPAPASGDLPATEATASLLVCFSQCFRAVVAMHPCAMLLGTYAGLQVLDEPMLVATSSSGAGCLLFRRPRQWASCKAQLSSACTEGPRCASC